MLKIIIAAMALLAPFANAETTWLTPDFQIIRVPAQTSPPNFATDCRAKIAQAVCLVDPSMGEKPADRVCLPGSSNYAPQLEALYDRLPLHLQKMFCRLERIFIEKKFHATAYASLMVDPNNAIIGAAMGVRKDFLDQAYTVEHWASWKEQLNFGGDPANYSTNPALPTIHSSSSDMLYYVVAHEFGHMFDFANNLNSFSPGSWSELAWKTRDDVKPDNDFSLRTSLCFYWCGGNYISPSKAIDVYNGLFSTNFISIYAASNPLDDWAETLAYYTVQHELNGTYDITLGDGTRFDIMAHLNSPLMASKVNFLEKLFQGGAKYPGDK